MSSNESNRQAANISNLQESFSKQQKKISALKELVRKSEVAHGKSTSTAQEKVKNIAQRLTHLKIKARSRQTQPTTSSPTTLHENEKLSTTFPSSDAGTSLLAEQQQHTQTQPQLQPSQLSHSFSYVEQKVARTPHSPGQMAIASTSQFTPLKQQHRSESSKSLSSTTTAGSEKVQLLRQQMEQNKLLMAQRASSKQHLEQLVSQLKEKFDTTQQCLEDTSELGKSMSDLSALMVRSPASRERHKSATDLSSQQPFSLEKERMKFLENRCRLLEKQLEKERQLHANQEAATNTINESGNQKRVKELENKVVELEKLLQERQIEVDSKIDETKQLADELERIRSDVNAKDEELCLMRLEQGDDNIHEFSELADLENNDIERLRNELADKYKRLNELEEINDILEATRCDLAMKNNQTENKLEQMKTEMAAANEKVQTLQAELQRSVEKCTSLEELVGKLQNSTEAVIVEPKIVDTTSVQVNEEMAKQIQELRDECDKLLDENRQLRDTISEKDKLDVSDVSIAEKIAALEATIESQREDLKERQSTISHLEEELMEKTIELNVLNANFKVLEEKLEASSKSKSLFSSSGADAADNQALEAEIQQLKQKLDESNKAMIKLKLKCKQSEKQVEKLKKSSDLHAEIIRLQALNEELQQKVTELEDEKGQWQLTQVDATAKIPTTESVELEEKYKTQQETIRLLEEQKYEQTQRLEVLEEKLQELQEQLDKREGEESERVKSEMSEIHFEEQVEEQAQQLQQLEDRLNKTVTELNEYKQKVDNLQEEKEEADKKLEKFMVENMELLDKIEKLSKSSSSAESIEIVERLTQQERAEIDEYNKRLDGNAVSSVSELTQTELAPELSDSLVKLREESSELMNKIELFTTERREVLERMEHLTNENHELIQKVEELTREKEEMETNELLANDAKMKLEERIKELSKEKDQLAVQVAEFKVQGNQMSQELSSLQKSSEVVGALDSKDDAALIQKCEKCLTNLSHELEIYRKAGDKNSKFNASKKLAKEAKNAHTQLSELLQKVKEASTAVETVTVVETVVAVTAPNGKALAEYEQLTTQNRILKQTIEDLRRELQEAREVDITEITAEPTATVAALTEDETAKEERQKQLEELKKYEEQCVELQSTVENLRLQLMEARTASDERSSEITQLNDELATLRKTSNELESLLSQKDSSYEKEVKEVVRLRKELEGKCDTYEGEMKILQTLIAEQKQQLIEAYKEHEEESSTKLSELQARDEEIVQLRAELKDLKSALKSAGDKLSEDLQKECEKLREALKINKNLVTEQVNELSNKQETIETLNKQIIDLYEAMEENANKIIEKEDELTCMQELLKNNNDELDNLRKDNEEQKSVVDKLLIELHSHRTTVEQIPQLENDIKRLQQENQRLDQNNKELEKRNKEQLEKLKKYAANLKKRATQCQELEAKVNELEKGSLEALQTKQSDSVDTKEQLKHQIEELKAQIELKSKEVTDATELISSLRNEMKQLQTNLTEKNTEIVQLQIALVDAQEQASGWGADSAIEFSTNASNAEIAELHKQLEEKTHKLKEAETEIYSMQEELIQVRESEREKYMAVRELEDALAHKNELIMNLQKQTQQTAQEGDKTSAIEEKVRETEERLKTLNEELKAKSLKFEKSKAVIKERNNQIQRLQAQLKDLQDKLSARPEEEYIEPALSASNLSTAPPSSLPAPTPKQPQVPKEVYDELQNAYEKLNERFNGEKSNFQATIGRLETLHDGIQAKLQENMSYNETLEQENANYKDKICRLEEGIASFEERRASMERRTNLLWAQMETRESEHEKAEDELIYRLNMLSDHDDIIAQRLLQTQEEKDELLDRIERIQAEFNQLSSNYAKVEKEYQTYRDQNEATIETETQALSEQLKAARTEVEHIRNVYDAKLASKTTELDELESELSEQLSKMNDEKRAMAEVLERTRDECNELKDEIVRLKESLNAVEQTKQELEREATWLRMQQEGSQQDQFELQELRMQTMQDKTEIDNLRHEIETLAANHEVELQALRTQISELDSLRMQVGQNQTDDQVFIETENKRLTDLLAEKESIIESYQRQNLQLQMAAAAAQSQASATQAPATEHDALALAFGLPQPSASSSALPATTHESARLERELLEKSEQIARLQRDFNTAQSEFRNVLESNHELQRQLLAKNQEIDSLRSSNFNTPTAAAVFGPPPPPPQQEIIPAPPLFFANEQATPSPFDEIIQVRSVDNLESSGRSQVRDLNNTSALEHPTIEDLQRNVSDLEKHAQDLENKLATRNQRELEIEERLSELEHKVRERVEELNAVRAELNKVLSENEALRQGEQEAQQQILEFQNSLSETQRELNERNEQLKKLELNAQQQQIANKDNQASDLMGLDQLQGNLEHLQVMLQQRDDELKQLRHALEDEKTLKERTSALESQIIPDSLANVEVDGASNKVPTLDMFFGGGNNSGANAFESLVIPPVSDVPVVEEAIVPEKAYVCHPDGSDAKTRSDEKVVVFDLDTDWGDAWGAHEAAAEEAHYTKTAAANLGARVSLVPREQQLEIQLAEQAERIAELELAVERCEQQKQEMQVKSGKLMKKLKEYKTKIDELQSSAAKGSVNTTDANSSFFDLDAAIQDELKMQIKQLEERLQEERKQHELHGVEKEKLLKRIDVLTAGSERMAEMKERQDMEVQMYKARIQELQAKVNRLEDWGPDGEAGAGVATEMQKQQQQQQQGGLQTAAAAFDQSNSAPPSNWEMERQHLNQRISELSAEILDINADRQELQALLEEEKSNVLRAEESLRTIQQQLATRDTETMANESAEKLKYNQLKAEHQQLQEKYNALYALCEEQTGELNRLKAREEQLTKALQQAQSNAQMSEAASTRVEQLSAELMKTENKLKESNAAVERLEADLDEVQGQLLELQTKNAELSQANQELQSAQAAVATVTMDTANVELLSNENAQLRAQNEILEQRAKQLERDIVAPPHDSTSTAATTNANGDIDELNAQLQEKESEIMHLKQRIEDLMREDQTEKLVLEILTKNQEIHMLKMQVKNLEDDKQELAHNLSVQITNEMQVNKSSAESENAKLQEQIHQLEKELQALQSEKRDMEEELKVLNNHVLSSLENEDKLKAAALQLDTQNIEIAELRRTIEALKASGSVTQTEASALNALNAPTTDYAALNAQWEAIVEQKCGEIAKMWRDHLEQREAEFKITETRLRDEIATLRRGDQPHYESAQPAVSAETTATSTPASVSTTQSGTSSGAVSKDGTPLRNRIINDEHETDADAIIEKMQAALESQEMEIVTLKEQLAIRSAEYARLAAQYDPFKLQNTTSHSNISSSGGGGGGALVRGNNAGTGSDASSLVPKSELDFALYMLHQRDMRCEEMTLELVSLLEERDTLQLKLSNTLRQVEAIKAATNYVEPPSSLADNTAHASPPSAHVVTHAPRAAVSPSSSGDSADELSQKLSQLQTVNHSKDKVIKEERDQRIRQMEKIQQDVAKMPQAAVSELVGTDAAQAGQSPSSVLLNWLWGNKPDSGNSAPY